MSTCDRLDLQALGYRLVRSNYLPRTRFRTMIGENQQLVTNEQVEFEK